MYSMSRVPYNKLLTNLANSSRTGEYWPLSRFVRTSLRSVRTVTTSGQYSPIRPSRSVSKRLLSTIIWLFFSELFKRDFVRSTLAAVVLLQLKFSRPFQYERNKFSGFESSNSFLTSLLRRNLTLPFFTFCCFFVVLVVSNFFALNMEQFEKYLSVVQFAFCFHHHNAHKPE